MDSKSRIFLLIKGMLMGAADAVPGVSGGTIAFMTGIYEELIHSLKQCGPKAINILLKEGFLAAWQHINGSFLLTLFSGIVLSMLTLSRLAVYLLEHHPIVLWAFFFGLILAATYTLSKTISHWRWTTVLTFILGSVSAFIITSVSPTSVEVTPLMIFISGMIAICAMILPGISGSFLLLLLGMYGPMMNILKNLEMLSIALFVCGCVIGLLSFSRVLSWLFTHHKTSTIALLCGFMLGSLNKVWPWKEVLETTLNRHGEVIPLVEKNVFPHTFETVTTQPSFLWLSVLFAIIGFILVFMMEKLSVNQPTH